jgi:NET1-associated nuclear protein 1 (U3 small nucleolar RNA-associated protein 17)
MLDDSYAVLRVSLVPVPPAPDNSFPSPSEIVAVGKTKLPTGLALSHNGAWLVATAGHKIYVANTSSLEKGFVKYVSPEKLTCLSFHPLEEYFATGDTKGVVRLWYCLNEQIETQMKAVGVEKKTQTSALHWHAHAVSAVSFSSDGAHLFSGGEEAVLVIWQLQTGRKEFIPRVGAPIKTISTTQLEDGEEVLLGLADATNLFVKTSTLKVVRSFSNVKIGKKHFTPLFHINS